MPQGQGASYLQQLPLVDPGMYDDFASGYENAPYDAQEGAAEYASDDSDPDAGEYATEDEYSDSYLGGSGLSLLGVVDVEGLEQRFTEIAHTNDMARHIWVDKGRTLQQRVVKDAQDLLAKAIVPMNEFAWHDQVMAFATRGNALGDKLNALPLDDNECPYWDELTSYLVDGSRLANSLEGVIDGSLKWADVKEGVVSFASGVKGAADSAASAVRWTTGLIVGGAVLLGGGLIYGAYKVLSGPAGQAAVGVAARRYLP